jgi:hypothetical protein
LRRLRTFAHASHSRSAGRGSSLASSSSSLVRSFPTTRGSSTHCFPWPTTLWAKFAHAWAMPSSSLSTVGNRYQRKRANLEPQRCAPQHNAATAPCSIHSSTWIPSSLCHRDIHTPLFAAVRPLGPLGTPGPPATTLSGPTRGRAPRAYCDL